MLIVRLYVCTIGIEWFRNRSWYTFNDNEQRGCHITVCARQWYVSEKVCYYLKKRSLSNFVPFDNW